MTGPEFASDRINQMTDLPDALAGIPDSEMENYLNETAAIRIPSDHVMAARAYVADRAAANPELYGLSENAKPSDIQGLVQRIRPLPINSERIQAAVAGRRSALL